MTDVPFDTMAAVRRLEAGGFSPVQAEAITQTVRDGVTGGVATKADLADVRADITDVRADITELRTDITDVRADITELRTDITELKTELKWIKLIGAAVLAVLVLPWLAEVISASMPG